MQPVSNFDYPLVPQTLEELELQYKRDAMELSSIRDKEEDEENGKHREVCSAPICLIEIFVSFDFLQPYI